VKGPVSSIKAAPRLRGLELPSNKLSSNYRERVPLKLGDESIVRSPPVVEVMFEVGEVTELEQKIRLT